MKNMVVFVFLMTAVSCSSSEKASSTRDGSSFEKAIIVKSVNAEYQWIREKYPNSQLVQQSLQFYKKKPYDVIRIKLENETEKDIYFDISRFFGRF